MINYNLRRYAAAALLTLATAGCATKGFVREKVSGLEDSMKKEVSGLQQRVEQVETRPYFDRPVMLKKGIGYNFEFGLMLGAVLQQYQDIKSRETARQWANSIALIPTGDRVNYHVLVGYDTNSDGKPTPGVDEVYTDKRTDNKGNKVKVRHFTIKFDDIPEAGRQLLNDVLAVPPKQ